MGYFRKQLAYSDLNESDPFIIDSRQDISDLINVLFTNNCKLLKYYGLTVKSQIELMYLGTGLRLNQHTLSRLRLQIHKTCNMRILGYISKFWGIPLPILLSKDFDPVQAKDIVVFPSFVQLPYKRVKSVKVK